ncbi:C39 family peptidase [Pseudomonas fluorescens]|uniref:Peptidase C39-like domain-containing protein n=1 Tax=Pseudomonas fluorescens TaxID=294 RepID=A0A5E7UM75_PSEFL|nr:C39 family peptidase [Pseudomonas fluorescens]VVQ10808.1 hypothetical protein PS922_04750 [Pseudomonas fluorescens]
MRNLISFFFISMLIMQSPTASAKTVGLDTLKVDESFKFQQDPVWCWAATIQMALNYYGFNVTQADIVSKTFGAAVSSTGNWIQMTNNLNYLGVSTNGKKILVSATVYSGSPSSEAIINHLKNKKPIIMAFNNPSTFTGHAILITGVDYHFSGKNAVIDKLIIRDPFPYNAMHVSNGGKITYPNVINPTNIWLIDATEEVD